MDATNVGRPSLTPTSTRPWSGPKRKIGAVLALFQHVLEFLHNLCVFLTFHPFLGIPLPTK